MKNVTFRLPKGKYIISDPCYVIPDDDWDDFLDRTDYCINLNEPLNYKGSLVWAAGTKWGDGGYRLKNSDNPSEPHFEIGVDAGMIGIIEIDGNYIKEENLDDSGKIVEFSHDVDVRYNGEIFMFGQYVIDTGFSYDNDDDDDDDDDDLN